jgi:hypothetical protein
LFGGGRLAFRGARGLGLFELQAFGLGGGGGHTVCGTQKTHRATKKSAFAPKENSEKRKMSELAGKYRELD